MVCSSLWSQKELDTTERLDNREIVWLVSGRVRLFFLFVFLFFFFFFCIISLITFILW